MSFTAAITVLAPLVANGLELTHEILRRRQPGREKDLEKHVMKKIELESDIEKIESARPSTTNTVGLENKYVEIKKLDKKIEFYQQLAKNELVRMSNN